MSQTKNPRLSALVCGFVFFCALCVLAANVLAQSELDVLAQKINRGNTEQKRDALFQIRKLKTAAASRLAVPALSDKREMSGSRRLRSRHFSSPDEAAQVLVPLLRISRI